MKKILVVLVMMMLGVSLGWAGRFTKQSENVYWLTIYSHTIERARNIVNPTKSPEPLEDILEQLSNQVIKYRESENELDPKVRFAKQQTIRHNIEILLTIIDGRNKGAKQ